MAYNKPYLTITQQIALLQSRGMGISDLAKARAALQRIGYYRLSGFWYPFRRHEVQLDGTIAIGDNFKPDTDLSTVIDLYVYDKKLRMLFLDVIERIEIALRVQLGLCLG